MNVLELRLGAVACQCGTNKDVVQLLRIHVVQVCVPLGLRDARNNIEVLQARKREEIFNGLDDWILIEVTSHNDLGAGVLSKDICNECL